MKKSPHTVEIGLRAYDAGLVWQRAFEYAERMLVDVDPEDCCNYLELFDAYLFEHFAREQPMTDELAQTIAYYRDRAQDALEAHGVPYELLGEDVD